MHTQALTDDGQLDMLHGHWLLLRQGAMFSVESVRLFVCEHYSKNHELKSKYTLYLRHNTILFIYDTIQ